MSALVRSLQKGAKVKGKRPLGQPIYLEGKPEGDKSMSVKRLNEKLCIVMHRKSCVQERGKAGFAEPKLPTVEGRTRRSRAVTAPLSYRHFNGVLRTPWTVGTGITNPGEEANGSLNTLNV